MINKLEAYIINWNDDGSANKALPDTNMILDKVNELIDCINKEKPEEKSYASIVLKCADCELIQPAEFDASKPYDHLCKRYGCDYILFKFHPGY